MFLDDINQVVDRNRAVRQYSDNILHKLTRQFKTPAAINNHIHMATLSLIFSAMLFLKPLQSTRLSGSEMVVRLHTVHK